MIERVKFRVGEKKRLADLRGEIVRLTEKVEGKRELAGDLPEHHRRRIECLRDIQQLDRRIASYGKEAEDIAETLKEVKPEASEKIARPRIKAAK